MDGWTLRKTLYTFNADNRDLIASLDVRFQQVDLSDRVRTIALFTLHKNVETLLHNLLKACQVMPITQKINKCYVAIRD